VPMRVIAERVSIGIGHPGRDGQAHGENIQRTLGEARSLT
jgi:hypothetical protein